MPVTPDWMCSTHTRPVSCIRSQEWSPIPLCGSPDLQLNVVPKRSRSSHLIWELMQSLIQYVSLMMSLHRKNVSQLHLTSIWSPSRWANTTFHQKRLEWSRWKAAVMGAMGNGPIRSHLILMQSFNVSVPLGLWSRFILWVTLLWSSDLVQKKLSRLISRYSEVNFWEGHTSTCFPGQV